MALLIIESIIIVVVLSLLMRLVLARWTNLIVHSIVWLLVLCGYLGDVEVALENALIKVARHIHCKAPSGSLGERNLRCRGTL